MCELQYWACKFNKILICGFIDDSCSAKETLMIISDVLVQKPNS